MKNLHHLQKDLRRIGIEYSIDNLRKLEIAGIIKAKRNKKNNYREMNETEYCNSFRNTILWCYWVPKHVILSGNRLMIKQYADRIIKTLRFVLKEE